MESCAQAACAQWICRRKAIDGLFSSSVVLREIGGKKDGSGEVTIAAAAAAKGAPQYAELRLHSSVLFGRGATSWRTTVRVKSSIKQGNVEATKEWEEEAHAVSLASTRQSEAFMTRGVPVPPALDGCMFKRRKGTSELRPSRVPTNVRALGSSTAVSLEGNAHDRSAPEESEMLTESDSSLSS